MKKMIDVCTGNVKIGQKDSELISLAIGSCIVVTLYDRKQGLGGMAHIMLPGEAPVNAETRRTRYARNAIDALLKGMDLAPPDHARLKMCLIGGGNVLKKSDDLICRDNTRSVKQIIGEKQLRIAAEALGGTERRTARLDVSSGDVYITEDNSKEMLLWRATAGAVHED